MSSVIDFLEKIGSDATWRDTPPEEMERVMAEAQIEVPLRTAILDQDTSALQALLRQKPLFMTQLPHEDEPDEDEDDEGEEGDGSTTSNGMRSFVKGATSLSSH